MLDFKRLFILFTLLLATGTAIAEPLITVHKSPSCGCCGKWVDYLRKEGFEVKAIDEANLTPIKEKAGVKPEMASCHTAMVDGYVLEGHVPADVIAKLLAERPAGVVGLAVPGMPMGSPGMESADGFKTPYQVMAFTQDGQSRVYATK